MTYRQLYKEISKRNYVAGESFQYRYIMGQQNEEEEVPEETLEWYTDEYNIRIKRTYRRKRQ